MFSKDFIWGVATASYQIEGAAYEDGKGLSVWDVFSKEEGKVYNMDSGDVACDSYHRVDEDIALLKELGVKAYRFSIAWPRIMPNGIGEVREEGLAYYEKLIDELIIAGIEPYITLYHWDLPYALSCKGAWLNDQSSEWFAEYTKVLVDRFGNKVKNWFTFNEPQCFIGHGYYTGVHAPGYKYGVREILKMAHNVNLAHGKAVKLIRDIVGNEAKVGFAYTAKIGIPNTETKEDIEATKVFMFNHTLEEALDGHMGFTFDAEFWMDPLFFGKYPDWVMDHYRDVLPDDEQLKKDFELITGEVDFMGLNVYSAPRIEMKNGKPETVRLKEGHAVTGLNWVVSEEMMYWGMKLIYERYGKAILITENGLSNKDWVALDGKVHDENRIDFLHRYLLQLERAYKDGVDIKGYFQWSFLDNFEWSEGYKERFGLVYVDIETGARTPKESYYWYKELITK